MMTYINDFHDIILGVMSQIADRYESDPCYSWIDTKFDLISGKSFTDKLRGKDTVYSWIQGRGLEAIVGHIKFMNQIMPSVENLELSERLNEIVEKLLDSLVYARQSNNGHLFFTLDVDGIAKYISPETLKEEKVNLAIDSPYNYSDLFCAKGMYAAAKYLGMDQLINQMIDYCKSVYKAVWDRSFRTDQQTMDNRNPVQYVEGRYSHGQYMISIGMIALLAENEADECYIDMGLRLIEYILDNHINLDNRWPLLDKYDFVEFVDEKGAPFLHDGVVLNDPGHSIEFVGLSLKFLDILRSKYYMDSETLARVSKIEAEMFGILRYNFYQGFNQASGGVCKLYDLTNKMPFNSDMPWWVLPETMRAATYCMDICSEFEREQCEKILQLCSESFKGGYVLSGNGFQYQTLSKYGEPKMSIPATPDLDPGYHTGLSFVDMLKKLHLSNVS
ncbi:MAG: hypothetical protein ACIAQZ_09850 [Sedimentisphaeraceae bacterium JB056]